MNVKWVSIDWKEFRMLKEKIQKWWEEEKQYRIVLKKQERCHHGKSWRRDIGGWCMCTQCGKRLWKMERYG